MDYLQDRIKLMYFKYLAAASGSRECRCAVVCDAGEKFSKS